MTNPCRRHFQRVTAAVAAAAVAGPAMTMEGASIYELHLAKLQQDYLRLKQVQSTEGKAELKRQLLPEYIPYVEGALAEGKGAQDQVLTTLMVWRMDATDFTGALDIADYVIKHSLLMPDRFERTTGTIVAEEIAEAALKAQKAGGAFDLSLLLRTAQITAQEDMPDQARAKLHLAIGCTLRDNCRISSTMRFTRATLSPTIFSNRRCTGSVRSSPSNAVAWPMADSRNTT